MQTYFKTFEGESIDIDKLFAFLKEHYRHPIPTDKLKTRTTEFNYNAILYSKEYLKWFFFKAGILGVIENDKQWLAVNCLGDFTLRYGNKQGAIFCNGLFCVHKKYTFTGLAQKVVKQTIAYSKSKYKLPVFGASGGGLKKETESEKRLFKRFGMFFSTELKTPKKKCFSSNNLYLCDDSDFLKKFRTEHGFAYYYPQEVIYEGNKEKWLVVPSYFTKDCWKTLIYECFQGLKNNFDRILIFENIERKREDLYEIGFENYSSYNLYLDYSPETPRYFLYFNLFLY